MSFGKRPDTSLKPFKKRMSNSFWDYGLSSPEDSDNDSDDDELFRFLDGDKSEREEILKHLRHASAIQSKWSDQTKNNGTLSLNGSKRLSIKNKLTEAKLEQSIKRKTEVFLQKLCKLRVMYRDLKKKEHPANNESQNSSEMDQERSDDAYSSCSECEKELKELEILTNPQNKHKTVSRSLHHPHLYTTSKKLKKEKIPEINLLPANFMIAKHVLHINRCSYYPYDANFKLLNRSEGMQRHFFYFFLFFFLEKKWSSALLGIS